MKAIFVYVLLGFATLALAQSEMNLSQIKMNLQNADEALKVSAVKSLMQEVNSRTRSQGSREALATSLVSTGELLAPVNTELIGLAKDESPRMRTSAALLLGYSKQTKEVSTTLLALGRDEDSDVQIAALRSFWLPNTRTAEAQNLIMELLNNQEDSSIFRDAALIASQWRMTEAIQPLMLGLKSDNPHFKVYAAGALADMGVKNAVPEMRKQLQRISEPSLRSLMLNAIDRLENPPPQAVAPPATTAQTTPLPSMATTDHTPTSVASPTATPKPSSVVQSEQPKSLPWPWITGAILFLAVAGGILLKLRRK